MTVLIITFLLIFLIAAISFYTYHVAFYAPPGNHPGIDEPMAGEQYEAVCDHIYRIGHIMEKYSCEEITIRSFDGCMLHGRYYHLRDEAPVEILFHGYRSCAFRDCSGGHALARKMGFNTLVIDQRAHGESEGKTITFGIKERHDCLCWVNYLRERFGEGVPLILSGISMGAATILMAAGLDLPSSVACIIADSPYSSPAAIIEKVCADRHYPVILCSPFIHLGAWLFGGFRLKETSAKDSVRHAKVPILLIHGEDDRLVPCAMSHEIAACCNAPVTVQTFPDAGHGLCYLIDPLLYEKVVYDFLQSIPSVAKEISANFMQQKF